MHGDDRRGDPLRYLELTRIHHAHFAALGAVGNRHLQRAKREIGFGWPPRSRRSLLVGFQWARNFALKNKELPWGKLVESLLRNAKTFGQHILGRVRHPIRQQNGGILRKAPIVENEQELRAIRIQSLNRVRNSGGEVPEIAF